MNFSLLSSEKLRDFIARIDPFASRIDPSTKLANHIQLAIDIARPNRLIPSDVGALILIEILDHELVRRIFIASGTVATDRLLCDITARLKSLLTRYSRLYYVGAGRFGILTPRSSENFRSLMKSIQQAMRKPFGSGNYTMMMDIVIGTLPIGEARADPVDALRKATVATYKAREIFPHIADYSPAFDTIQRRKHHILQEIPDAIAQDQFSLVFQPKIDPTGAAVGAEALLRWTHPRLGRISPAEFIPLADNTELMVDITRWVVRHAILSCKNFSLQGIDLKIALNVSSRNLDDPGFSDFMLRSLREFDVQPGSIQVECTEYSALKSKQCVASLHALSGAGLTIALDDFGNGHSNLASLQHLPIDLLKIDRSLIAPIADDMHALRLLEGVIELGKSLNYRIVAEGVETLEVLRMLQSLEIDEMQGYAIAKPVDFEGLLKFFRHPRPQIAPRHPEGPEDPASSRCGQPVVKGLR